MTQEADVARLAEQTAALQRQCTRLEAEAREAERRIGALTDAKFVTYRTLIDSQAEKVALALNASELAISKQEAVTDRALTKQELATEKRFESVNEFRAQQRDVISNFMPRSEHAVEVGSLREAIARTDELVKSMQIWQGNITGRIAVLGAVFAVLMTVIVFAANYLTKS